SRLTGLGHAFFASDGASAVEIALKMSFHYWRNLGLNGKTRFISLQGSYHGETLGALSVTDVAVFHDAYAPLLNNNLLAPFPAFDGKSDVDYPCCVECADAAADSLERLLEERHDQIAALIVEPLVQGATGMRMYHPQYLRRARELCKKFNVHLIADEIMTGFGRTGTMFAWEQVSTNPNMRPDFMCLSKGITGGYLPLSCVLSTDTVYRAFYDDHTARGFLHSHSYTGSALACRAALATLDIFESDNVIVANRAKTRRFSALMTPLRQHPRVSNYRQLGVIWAFDVSTSLADFAKRIFAAGLARGVLLRPIGNTIYFMPPYVTDDGEFLLLVRQTLAAIDEVLA
ncbi:MAG: aminotransferase class III-fold pyridoxal phosphate-dependent enzyme, partial [Burkholderiales bacterium]